MRFKLSAFVIFFLSLIVLGQDIRASEYENMKALLNASSLPIINLTLDSALVNSDSFSDGFIEVAQYGETDFKAQCSVRYRGSIALNYNKKNYSVKLLDEDGDDYDYNMLGIRKDNSWILDGMQADRLRMANKTCFDVWNSMSRTPYETDYEERNGIICKFVELYVNGWYGGLYCLSDKVDRKLLGLKKALSYDGINIYKGVMYKCTCLGTTSARYLTSYRNASMTGTQWNSWELDYPSDYPSEEAWGYLKDLIDEFQDLDEDSFLEIYGNRFFDYNLVDYVTLLNGLHVEDCAYKNSFLSIRNVNDSVKFLVTPWDMDFSLGYMGSWHYTYNRDIYFLEDRMPYNYLFALESGEFKERMRDRWKELRVGLLHPDSLSERMRGYASEIVESGAWNREYDKWGSDSSYYYIPLKSSIYEQLDEMEKWYSSHYANLDEQYGIEDESSGIRSTANGETGSGKSYNLHGIEVNEGYKGIVIRNGKKYIRR